MVKVWYFIGMVAIKQSYIDRFISIGEYCVCMTPSEIRNILSENGIPIQMDEHESVGSCRRVSNEVYKAIEPYVNDESIHLVQGQFIGESNAQHFYVKIGDSIIIDPTVSQFTYDNWVDRKADTYIECDLIPDDGIITADMETLFDKYQ